MACPLGRIPYGTAMTLMSAMQGAVSRGVHLPGVVLTMEHPATITLGRSATETDVLLSAVELDRLKAEVVRTDRGGGVTYHGPGQLVVYPVVSLRALGMTTAQFIVRLAELTISLLTEFGLSGACYDADRPGVWVAGKKIASIGLRIRRGVVTHGLSLNLESQPGFSWIVPCRMPELEVTSLTEETGALLSLKGIAERWVCRFAESYSRDVRWTTPEELLPNGPTLLVDNLTLLNNCKAIT